MTKFDDFLRAQLQDEAVRAEYDALAPEFAIIQAMIDARKAAGITQKQLAEKTGIDQADISKLENGNANPSIRTMQRLAAGMGMRLKVEFVPRAVKRPLSSQNRSSKPKDGGAHHALQKVQEP